MRSPFSTGPDRLEPRRYLQRRMWTTNSDRRVKYLLPFVVTSALAGCAGPRTTVGDGFLQKRQHLSGWHLDMGKRDHGRSEPVRSKVERMHIRDVEPGSSARLKRPVPSSGTVSSTQDGTLASTSNSISDAIGSSKMHPSNLPLTDPRSQPLWTMNNQNAVGIHGRSRLLPSPSGRWRTQFSAQASSLSSRR